MLGDVDVEGLYAHAGSKCVKETHPYLVAMVVCVAFGEGAVRLSPGSVIWCFVAAVVLRIDTPAISVAGQKCAIAIGNFLHTRPSSTGTELVPLSSVEVMGGPCKCSTRESSPSRERSVQGRLSILTSNRGYGC